MEGRRRWSKRGELDGREFIEDIGDEGIAEDEDFVSAEGWMNLGAIGMRREDKGRSWVEVEEVETAATDGGGLTQKSLLNVASRGVVSSSKTA